MIDVQTGGGADALHGVVSVRVGDQSFGAPVLQVQDVITPTAINTVPLAPAEVAGSLNLRGRIVTAIDMRRRLNMTPRGPDDAFMCVIVERSGELYLRARDRIHVHGLQFSREPHIPRLVRLDDHVAHAALDGELQQIVHHLGVSCDGCSRRHRWKSVAIPYFAAVGSARLHCPTDMKLRPLTGTITALATPFRDGQVSYADLKKLVAHQLKGGIDGLVPVGTTGESPTLTWDEHLEVIRFVIAEARGRVPVIAGTGSNSTHEAVELTRLSHEAGADAMLVVAPYYNKPSQEGLFRHFSALAETTDKPIILYSIPGRCGIEISVGVVERLRAKYKHVAWIKEAGGSVDRVDQLKQALGSDVTVLSGDDSLTLPFMAVGAEGVISVASNLYVREIGKMVRFALANDFRRAAKLHRALYPAFKTLFIEPNPVPIKHALQRAGIIASAEVRSPLCEMTPASTKVLEQVLAGLD